MICVRCGFTIQPTEAKCGNCGAEQRPKTPRTSPGVRDFFPSLREEPSIDRAPYLIGEVVAERFEMLDLLGSSAFTTVYRALDRQDGREYAVKVFSPQLFDEPSLRHENMARLYRAVELEHPNICRTFRIATDGDNVIAVQQLLVGITLDRLLDRRRQRREVFAVPDVLPVAEQILDALHYLTGAGELAVDLSPRRIVILPDLLTLTGHVQLRRPEGKGRQPSPYSITGLMGERQATYALGTLLAEMLCGFIPSIDESIANTVPNLPLNLEALLRRARNVDAHPVYGVERMRDELLEASVNVTQLELVPPPPPELDDEPLLDLTDEADEAELTPPPHPDQVRFAPPPPPEELLAAPPRLPELRPEPASAPEKPAPPSVLAAAMIPPPLPAAAPPAEPAPARKPRGSGLLDLDDDDLESGWDVDFEALARPEEHEDDDDERISSDPRIQIGITKKPRIVLGPDREQQEPAAAPRTPEIASSRGKVAMPPSLRGSKADSARAGAIPSRGDRADAPPALPTDALRARAATPITKPPSALDASLAGPSRQALADVKKPSEPKSSTAGLPIRGRESAQSGPQRDTPLAAPTPLVAPAAPTATSPAPSSPAPVPPVAKPAPPVGASAAAMSDGQAAPPPPPAPGISGAPRPQGMPPVPVPGATSAPAAALTPPSARSGAEEREASDGTTRPEEPEREQPTYPSPSVIIADEPVRQEPPAGVDPQAATSEPDGPAVPAVKSPAAASGPPSARGRAANGIGQRVEFTGKSESGLLSIPEARRKSSTSVPTPHTPMSAAVESTGPSQLPLLITIGAVIIAIIGIGTFIFVTRFDEKSRPEREPTRVVKTNDVEAPSPVERDSEGPGAPDLVVSPAPTPDLVIAPAPTPDTGTPAPPKERDVVHDATALTRPTPGPEPDATTTGDLRAAKRPAEPDLTPFEDVRDISSSRQDALAARQPVDSQAPTLAVTPDVELRDLEPETHDEPDIEEEDDQPTPDVSPDTGTTVQAPTLADLEKRECPRGLRRILVPARHGRPAWGFCIEVCEYPSCGSRPKTSVTLSEAQSLCRARKRRLCSWREWRRGCGGTYPYGKSFDAKRCNTLDERGAPRPVVASGTFRGCRSPYGLFDMSGNVSEWTSNGFVNGGRSTRDGKRTASCNSRARRSPNSRSNDVGFRCCSDLGE